MENQWVTGVLYLIVAVIFCTPVRAQLADDHISGIEDEDFSCPSDELISPCNCYQSPPFPTVHCGDLPNLKTMHRALKNRFTENPIPYLKIADCNIRSLPSRAFVNITVTRLEIKGSNLQFVASDAFQGLESLLFLILHNVRLSDVPAQSLEYVPLLETLSLSKNFISTLTQSDLRHVTGLKHFVLANNRISNIERGAFPIGLLTLSLANNHLLTLNSTVRNLPYLEWLFLADNRLTSIDGELEGLYNLKLLNLANNLLTTVGDTFNNLHNLKSLSLEYNSIYYLGESLKHLSQLQRLNFSHNIISELDSGSFRNLTALQNLDLSRNDIRSLSSSLIPLENLIVLNLSGNNLHTFSFHEIRTLRKLKELDLSEAQLTSLQRSNQHRTIVLEVLLLARNQLERLHGFIRHFPSLEELDISYNLITRLKSRDFELSRYLGYLNVEGNPLICDLQQVHVLHELESRTIEIEGMPTCSVTPNML